MRLLTFKTRQKLSLTHPTTYIFLYLQRINFLTFTIPITTQNHFKEISYHDLDTVKWFAQEKWFWCINRQLIILNYTKVFQMSTHCAIIIGHDDLDTDTLVVQLIGNFKCSTCLHCLRRSCHMVTNVFFTLHRLFAHR